MILSFRLIIGFIFKPYFNRVRLGEGGLVVFNLCHSLYAHRDYRLVIIETLISFLVLSLLYGFNDFTDRHYDANNPKKDQQFSRLIVNNEKLFLGLNASLTLLTVLMVALLMSQLKVIAIIMVFVMNYIYSKKLKAFPIADILAVSFWGGLYVMLSGEFSVYLICTAGVMTGIAHLFQMITDKSSDGVNKIKTTIVALPGSEVILLTGSFLVLAVMIFCHLGLWWSLTVAVPVFFYVIGRNVTLSWYLSRVYFFICWMALLNLTYGNL